jgi:hypothetical protein
MKNSNVFHGQEIHLLKKHKSTIFPWSTHGRTGQKNKRHNSNFAKEIEFKKRFLEMALISLGIAGLSFVIGYLVNTIFNVAI